MKGTYWTDTEEEIVKQYSLISSKEEMLKLLPNRTWKAIRHKALKMGLKLKNDYEKIPNDELFKIINNENHMKCKSCRRYLPFDEIYYPTDKSCRTGFRSICKECKGENFGIRELWANEEAHFIKKYYKTMTNREIQEKFLPNKTLEQINHKANILGLLKNEDVVYKAKIDAMDDNWRQKISNTRIINGLAKGVNNPMYGTHRTRELNPNWQGGISDLYGHLRRNLTQWKLDSAKEYNYKCVFTGERFDDIHHLYSFHNIIQETLDELSLPLYSKISNYSQAELKALTDKCIEIHYMYPLGVPMKQDIHMLFHSIYSYQNNTPEQFEEFKIKYYSNEFERELQNIS